MKQIKGMQLGAMLAAMLLVSMAFVPAVSARPSQNSDEVSESQARQVAELFIKKISVQEIPEWDNAIPSNVTEYYNLDERLAAYSFVVSKDGLYLGYLLVSASKSNYPVLEFSKGKSPDMNAESITENSLKTIKNRQTLGNKRIYYLSGLEYLVEYPIIENGIVTNNISFDINTGKPIDISQIQVSIKKLKDDIKVKDHLKNRELEAKQQWMLVEQQKQNSQDKTVTISSLYGVHIYDVPAYTDSDGDGVWDGCSAIAGAMILGYWDLHGYPNFPSQNNLIDETHVAMGTDSNGATWIWNIPIGMVRVAENHGYNNFGSINDYWVSWSDVTNEIDANRPFVLSMTHGGTGSGQSQPYGDHSTADVGYAIDSGTNAKYVLLHDTWDTNTHYLAFGDWWGATESVVRT